MKAVIMAGGEGTRLRPLTCNIPKPMVPLVNRPMMEHILNLLKRHNITEVANTLWYMPDVIQDYFGDGSGRDVNMQYFIEEKPLGTAGSVKNAQRFLDQAFVVVSGDSLTDIDLTKAIKFHKQKGALATLVLTRVANPLSYGVVITNEGGKITRFLEKPSWSEVFSDTVNTGIYILEPEVLAEIPINQKYDFSQNLFPQLLAKGAPMYGYVSEGYWSDVGNLAVYRQSQYDALDGKVALDLPVPTRPGIWIEDQATIADDVLITGPVYIGSGVQISSGCELGAYTVLGDYSQLDPRVSIKRSTLWHGVKVGRDSQLRGVVAANSVCIDSNVQAYEGSVIGEKTHIGTQSKIAPNMKIWPEKQISSGTQIKQSLVWGSQTEPNLFSATGVKGDVRSFLTPEFITRFGLAYGGFIRTGNEVLVSSDSSALGRLGKRALIAGLLAAGIHVLDSGTVAGNMTRFGVQYAKTAGALHCQQVQGHDNQINIQCWDQRGHWLSKADERKIENLLWREDFPRQTGSNLGKLAYLPGLVDQYIANLAKLYQPSLAGFALSIQAEPESDWADLVTMFLTQAGCQLTNDESEIGITITTDSWSISDQDGLELTEDQWWQLFLHSQKLQQKKRVAVPADVSYQVANVASDQEIQLTWTKKDPRVWMEIASELGNTQIDDTQQSEYFPYIEPLVSIGEVLSYINNEPTGLNQTLTQSPTVKRTQVVFCPWDAKGTVMRKLINAADPADTEFLDGLKQHTENGWVLVVPDGDEPVFKIYSEANTAEEADALTQYYANAISGFIQEAN